MKCNIYKYMKIFCYKPKLFQFGVVILMFVDLISFRGVFLPLGVRDLCEAICFNNGESVSFNDWLPDAGVYKTKSM